MPEKRRPRPYFACLLVAGVMAFPLPGRASVPDALSPEEADSLALAVDSIPVRPLELLPASDCRLDEIEEAVALLYPAPYSFPPARLAAALSRKRETIDRMRSHVDSLYYLQALRAIDQENPDWESAMEAIGKSLLHNRFFARSVVFKMNYLLKKEKNAQACLRYLNATLQEFSHNPKVRKMAQATYNTLLEQIQKMLEKGLHRDALQLCGMLDRYCQEGFPIQYVPYKEKQLENLAYQGIYQSYFDVASKAFQQDQVQLAQKYATVAHDFYAENEDKMAGVDYALELLDKIATRYLSYAALSDKDEQSYYQALVDEIVKETGLVVSAQESYDADADIAADIALMNAEASTPPGIPENGSGAGFVPLEAADAGPLAQLSLPQAREQYARAEEQASYFRSKRQFSKAQDWLAIAYALQSAYPIKAGSGFAALYADNTVRATEQLLNKAAYNLWVGETQAAETLHARAQGLFLDFQKKNPQDASTLTRLQQLLSGFQSQIQETACRKFQQETASCREAFYRQASYGNFEIARHKLQEWEQLFQSRQSSPALSSCQPGDKQIEEARTLMTGWARFEQEMDSARQAWDKKEVPRFLDLYSSAIHLFDSMQLSRHLPKPVSLFSRLSSAKEYEALRLWAEICMARQDMEQARFLLEYLQAQGYKEPGIEKNIRNLRKTHEKKGKPA